MILFTWGPNSYWNFEPGVRIVFNVSARFSKGIVLNCFNNALLVVGDKITSNANLLLSCANRIVIGEDVLLGWDITIMDNDEGHTIIYKVTKIIINESWPIVIGNHVWISAEAAILKGAEIADVSIIGFKSNVCGLRSADKNLLLQEIPQLYSRKTLIFD